MRDASCVANERALRGCCTDCTRASERPGRKEGVVCRNLEKKTAQGRRERERELEYSKQSLPTPILGAILIRRPNRLEGGGSGKADKAMEFAWIYTVLV